MRFLNIYLDFLLAVYLKFSLLRVYIVANVLFVKTLPVLMTLLVKVLSVFVADVVVVLQVLVVVLLKGRHVAVVFHG